MAKPAGGARTGSPAQARISTPIDRPFARELVFIDPRVDDLETLLSGLRPDVGAILLDAATPAPAQIARSLAGVDASSPLEAVHVIAHGSAGEVSFAAGALSLANLLEHEADLESIGAALGEGSLNLWTCRTAEGAAGQAFIDSIAQVLGTRVAASDGLVGAARLGGSWELRAGAPGAVAQLPLTAAGAEAYAGGTYTVGPTALNATANIATKVSSLSEAIR